MMEKCRAGLHDYTPDNQVVITSTGRSTCKECRRASQRRWDNDNRWRREEYRNRPEIRDRDCAKKRRERKSRKAVTNPSADTTYPAKDADSVHPTT